MIQLVTGEAARPRSPSLSFFISLSLPLLLSCPRFPLSQHSQSRTHSKQDVLLNPKSLLFVFLLLFLVVGVPLGLEGDMEAALRLQNNQTIEPKTSTARLTFTVEDPMTLSRIYLLFSTLDVSFVYLVHTGG